MVKRIKVIFADEYDRNILLNYVFKAASILLGLINTRFVLGYLGNSLYGLWVTVTSVVAWMNSGDLGIGNGLRNGIAKAYGENDREMQTKLIETAFSSLFKVAFILFSILLLVCEILFQTNTLTSEVRIAIYITAIFFCCNLVLSISQSVALGYQKSWLSTLTLCEIQFFSILFVLLLSELGIEADLNIFALVNGIVTTIPNIVLILLLNGKGIKIINRIKLKEDKAAQKTIMTLGIRFFVIQLCAVVLYSTDSLIINKFISSEMVTKYAMIAKVYDTGTSLFSILLIALWSAVTFHLAQNNIEWIKNKIRQLLLLWGMFSCGVVAVSVLFNYIIEAWLGLQAIHYEWPLIWLFGAHCSMAAFSAIFVNVLNGMGEVRLQLVLAVISALINIPLSVFLAQNCGMGILGVKMATFISVTIIAITMPLQTIIELRKRTRTHDNKI